MRSCLPIFTMRCTHLCDQRCIISIDGTDCHIWEPKHPTLSQDQTYWSHKFNKAALRYEIGISVYKSKCMWINGPFKCGMQQDLPNFKSALKDKIAPNKKAVSDRNYVSTEPGMHILATPNPMDSKELRRFKSRIHLHHETFNGRIKFFNCLALPFRHGIDKHKIAFEAVCVIVQYQMDNGAELYVV